MSKSKKAEIYQSHVHKAYWKSSSETKNILETIFPFLTKGIYLHKKENVNFEDYRNQSDEEFRRYYYIHNNKVVSTFIISRSKLKYHHKRVIVKDIPPKFLKKVGFFRKEE